MLNNAEFSVESRSVQSLIFPREPKSRVMFPAKYQGGKKSCNPSAQMRKIEKDRTTPPEGSGAVPQAVGLG